MINSSHIYFLLMLDILRGFLQVSHLHLESSWHVCQTYPSAPSYSQQSDQGQYTFFFSPRICEPMGDGCYCVHVQWYPSDIYIRKT